MEVLSSVLQKFAEGNVTFLNQTITATNNTDTILSAEEAQRLNHSMFLDDIFKENMSDPFFTDYNWDYSNFTNQSKARRPSFIPSDFEKGMIMTIYSLMCLLGLILNIITIVVFLMGKRSSSRDIRILIINLAIADLMYSISGPIPNALDIIGVNFVDNVYICRMYRFLYILSAYGSPLANLAIAIERLIIVFSHARTLRLRNRRRTMFYIVGAFWLFDFIVTAEYLASPTIKKKGGDVWCQSNTWMAKQHPKVFNWLLVVKFCGPSILIVVIYSIIAAKITLCRPIGTVSMDAHLQKQSKARNQMVKMLFIVASVTLIAWLPYNIWSIFYAYYDPLDDVPQGNHYADTVLFALQLTNAFTSPIVYFVYDRYFKRDFLELFGCKAYARSRGMTSSQPTQTTTTARITRPVPQNQAATQRQSAQRQQIARRQQQDPWWTATQNADKKY